MSAGGGAAAPPPPAAEGTGGPELPARGLRGRLALALLRLLGWRVRIAAPPGPRGVIIVYPHTSNWDFFVGYAAKVAIGLPLRWIGKHTIFRWPVAGVLRWMGGIPVNRSAPGGLLEALANGLRTAEWMWLVLAPEGTRKRTDHLKSGFYRLARAADVPVGLAYIDWRAREIGLREYVALTGDEATDLARIRAAYEGKAGKRPGLESDLRFRAGA